uniref:Ctr_13_TN conopeptide n=1 Tax=Conus tribblei TaxID=101761 RepID=A0A0C9SEK7_CONTD
MMSTMLLIILLLVPLASLEQNLDGSTQKDRDLNAVSSHFIRLLRGTTKRSCDSDRRCGYECCKSSNCLCYPGMWTDNPSCSTNC